MWEDRRGRIDPDRLVTLWSQVAEDIEQQIDAGELEPGSKLPGEIELAGLYGVARLTVRRAVKDLAERGVLVVIHGRGTFVRSAS